MQDKTGNWYGNYTPALSNQPASSWKAADYGKHNGDTFINPTTGDVYVFSTGTAGLEITFNSNCKTESVSFDWVEIYYEDNGVKKALPKLGGSFGGKKVQVPGNVFWLYWRTDTSSCSFYGFKIDSIASIMLDKSQVSGTTKALPSYSVTNVSGSTYPESPNHNNYGNNINMLWKYTGTASSATAQWKKVAKVDVEELMKQLDQETIFNILTNNGEAKGIYLKDKQLYISFTYAQGGTLKLGGANNDNGIMQILNSSGGVIGSWDKDGIIASKGKIADFNIENGGLYKEKDGLQQTFGTDSAILSIFNTSSQKWIMYLSTDGHAVFNMDANYTSSDFAFGGSVWFTGAGEFGGGVRVGGDLTVYGDKNREVDTENYGRRLAYCYETATPYFGDLGHGMTDENGVCLIEIDDIFREIVGEQEYLVFLQPEGEGNLYVNKAEKYCNYFIVRGTANLSFAWEIKSIQKEKQFTRFGTDSERGMLDIDYTDLEETLVSEINNPLIETEESLWNLTDLQE